MSGGRSRTLGILLHPRQVSNLTRCLRLEPGYRILLIPIGLIILGLIPVSWIAQGVPCAARYFLGFDCPGCGLLRSWALTLRWQWDQAFQIYPLGPLFLVGVGIWMLDELRVMWRPLHYSRIVRPQLGCQWVGFVLILIGLQWFTKILGLWSVT